jgi:CubicO group peptidase (beta-lactamase class C family)
MKRNSVVFLLGVVLLVTVCTPGIQIKIDRIDEVVNRYKELGEFNGCVLVAENGKIIYEKVSGIAHSETGESLTVEHRFRLASVSKQFTAMAAMILKEQGKLSYDDDIQKYLPELPYKGVTIRHLLTHTSGLPDYTSLLEVHWDVEHKGTMMRKIATNTDVLGYLIKYKPSVKFTPGEKHSYCNTGYNLLAIIVERISKMSFQEFMRVHIFEPLDMKDSFVNERNGLNPDEKRARGILPGPDNIGFVLSDFHYQNGMYGDGGIYSTLEDMFRWDQALYSEKLVSRETIAEAFTPSKLNGGELVDYGFGWSLINTEEGKVVAHGGGWLGFRAFILRDLESKNTVIQLCNMPGISKGALAFTILNILHGKEYDLPKK